MIFRLQARSDGDRLFERDAEPVHAGIDVEGRAATPVSSGDERIPFRKFGGAVDDRAQIIGCECLRRARHHSIENIDDCIGGNRAHAPAFTDIGNEEGATARAGQRTRDRLEPTAIAIPFDHRSALDWHRHARERLPIGRDGTEINREDATGFCRIGTGTWYFGWPQLGFVHRHGQNLWPAETLPSRPSGANAVASSSGSSSASSEGVYIVASDAP